MKKKTFEKKIAKEIKRVDELLKYVGKVALPNTIAVSEIPKCLVLAGGALAEARNVIHAARKPPKPSKKETKRDFGSEKLDSTLVAARNAYASSLEPMKIRRTKKR